MLHSNWITDDKMKRLTDEDVKKPAFKYKSHLFKGFPLITSYVIKPIKI